MNQSPIAPLFFICGLIYAISTSPEKKGTSLAAFAGFLIGLFAGAALEEFISANNGGHVASAFAQLFSVLFAVYHSRKAKNRAKAKAQSAVGE